jgi:precorrin-3B C17-methyltransferase
MTGRVRLALAEAEIICGYDGYLELLAGLFPEKPRLGGGMGREVERCRSALGLAAEGRRVALVCGGDAGVYGMAGLVCQLAPEYPGVELEVAPGVPAAQAGAALLGAPLGHDFAGISLSDRLTPWPVIENRLRAAAAADFVLCLHNPASRARRDHLRRAAGVLLEILPPETLCGWARRIGRPGQSAGLLRLNELGDFPADMWTLVFVGARTTREIRGRMVTPRGYDLRGC